MGAQGFPETDYSITEYQDNEIQPFQKNDLDIFQDLKSDQGIRSEVNNPFYRKVQNQNNDKKQIQNTRNILKSPQNVENMVSMKDIRTNVIHGQINDHQQQIFDVTFRIKYETNIGESLCIIGDAQEIGNWKDFKKGQMKWTQNHIWVLEQLIVKSQNFLCYKYVLVREDNQQTWENGENRIVDLQLLPDQSNFDSDILDQVDFFQKQQNNPQNRNRKVKKCDIFDEWQIFRLNFQVFSQNEDTNIFMSGSLPQLGSKEKPLKLEKTQRPFLASKVFMNNKYGKIDKINVYQVSIKMNWSLEPALQIPQNVKFKFYRQLKNQKQTENERVDSGKNFERLAVIQKSENFKNRLQNKDNTNFWIVNGQVNINCGNFLGTDFIITKIKNTGLSIGPFIGNIFDLKELKQNGIKSIINLQIEDEMIERDLDQYQIEMDAQRLGLNYQKYPLKENNFEKYCNDILGIANQINQIVEYQQQSLYLNCSSGITRSPTVAIVYLSLYKKIQGVDNYISVYNLLKSLKQDIVPNMKALDTILSKDSNQESRNHQFDIVTQFYTGDTPRLPDIAKVNNFDADNFRKQQDKKSYNYETSSAKDNEKEKYKNKIIKQKRDLDDPYKFNDDNSSGCGIKSMSSAPWDLDDIEKDQNPITDTPIPQNEDQIMLQTNPYIVNKFSFDQNDGAFQEEVIKQQIVQKKQIQVFKNNPKKIQIIDETKRELEKQFADFNIEKVNEIEIEKDDQNQILEKQIIELKQQFHDQINEKNQIIDQQNISQQNLELLIQNLQGEKTQIENEFSNEKSELTKIILNLKQEKQDLEKDLKIAQQSLNQQQEKQDSIERSYYNKEQELQLLKQKHYIDIEAKDKEIEDKDNQIQQLNEQNAVKIERIEIEQQLKYEHLLEQNILSQSNILKSQMEQQAAENIEQFKEYMAINGQIVQQFYEIQSKIQNYQIDEDSNLDIKQINQQLQAHMKDQFEQMNKINQDLLQRQQEIEQAFDFEKNDKNKSIIQEKSQQEPAKDILKDEMIRQSKKETQKQNLRYEQKQSTARSHEPNLNDDQNPLQFNQLIISESLVFAKTQFQSINYPNQVQLIEQDTQEIQKTEKKSDFEKEMQSMILKEIEKLRMEQIKQKQDSDNEIQRLKNELSEKVKQTEQLIKDEALKQIQIKEIQIQKDIENKLQQSKQEQEMKIKQELEEQKKKEIELEKQREEEKRKQILYQEEEQRKQNEFKQQQLRLAQEAHEKAQKLKEEIQKLEEIKVNREQFDTVIAKVSGEIIIDQIQKYIVEIFNQEKINEQERLENEEKEAQRQKEELRMQEELKLQEIQRKVILEMQEREKLEIEQLKQKQAEQEKMKKQIEQEEMELKQKIEYELKLSKLQEQKQQLQILREQNMMKEKHLQSIEKKQYQDVMQQYGSIVLSQSPGLSPIQNRKSSIPRSDGNQHSLVESFVNQLAFNKRENSVQQRRTGGLEQFADSFVGKTSLDSQIDNKSNREIVQNIQPLQEHKDQPIEIPKQQYYGNLIDDVKIQFKKINDQYKNESEKSYNQLDQFEHVYTESEIEDKKNQQNNQIVYSQKTQEDVSQQYYKKQEKNQIQDIHPKKIFQQGFPPIQFKPKKGNKMEEQILKIQKKIQFLCPISPIKPGLYLIGCNRVNLDYKFDQVLVKIGGGTEKLEDYMTKNEYSMQKVLIDHMLNSGNQLDWVVEQLKNGNKIKQSFYGQINLNDSKLLQSDAQKSEQSAYHKGSVISLKKDSKISADTRKNTSQNPQKETYKNIYYNGIKQQQSVMNVSPSKHTQDNNQIDLKNNKVQQNQNKPSAQGIKVFSSEIKPYIYSKSFK